jgi:protoporphyrinogen oxidase
VATLSTGGEVAFRAVVATIPLPELVRLADGAPPEILEAAGRLRATTVTYVNVAARDVGAPPFHWVYLPEKKYTPYRIGSASSAVASLAPQGCRSFYVEFSDRAPLDPGSVVPRAIEALLDIGFLRSRSDVIFAEARHIPHAYVIYDEAYGAARKAILDWLAGRDILTAGRYGNWEYSSMEDALLGGRESARKVA